MVKIVAVDDSQMDLEQIQKIVKEVCGDSKSYTL